MNSPSITTGVIVTRWPGRKRSAPGDFVAYATGHEEELSPLAAAPLAAQTGCPDPVPPPLNCQAPTSLRSPGSRKLLAPGTPVQDEGRAGLRTWILSPTSMTIKSSPRSSGPE